MAAAAPTAQERLRRLLLAVALAVGLPLTFLSLIDLPYHRPVDWGTGITTVNAVGRQWEWTLSENSFHVGDRVEFRVTSDDVNHGFALYDPAMRVVAQTQAASVASPLGAPQTAGTPARPDGASRRLSRRPNPVDAKPGRRRPMNQF